ncbi:MAG: amidohydrolase family protein [Actinomycetota bacterium]|nr:amidohydrolase family protein [Actinomycetota bacterium]
MTRVDRSTMLLTGRVVTADGVVADGAVVVDRDRVVWAGRRADLSADDAALPLPDSWHTGLTLLPGLVDVHCHGGAGGEFGPDAVASRTAAAHHHRSGTTSVVASLVSAAPHVLVDGVHTCAALVATGELAGIHLEGPFLSYERRGAQDPDALSDPDPGLIEALSAAASAAGAHDALLQMTFAPERPGADALPALLARHGIVASVGHTDTDADTAWTALRQVRELAPRGGRPLVTHVFNGMPPMHHRSPGPVAAAIGQAGRGDAVLEMIGDGVHLAAGTVRMLFDAVGPDAICLVTDAMAASGMPDGRYTLGGRAVVVADRTARLADGGAIAGGVATLLDVVRWCVDEVGVPLVDAVSAATRTPARSMALSGVGELVTGGRADVLVVDDGLEVVSVLRAGRWLTS